MMIAGGRVTVPIGAGLTPGGGLAATLGKEKRKSRYEGSPHPSRYERYLP